MARLHRRFASGAYGLPVPGLALDFINNPASALSLLTFTRASSGTYFDSAGMIQTATTNVARLDYNPSTLVALGLLIEEARTNVILWTRDLTNAAWTASNVTPLKNITGIDGVANSASRITATAGNGTILQAITLASSARFQTAWVKRITGTGVVNMTMDNGATWTAVTVTAAWTRVSIPTQTLANPTVGFQIVTSGDAIAIDYVQNENGTFATSSIATTTASVTRAADVCSILTSAFPFNASAGTIVAEAMIPAAVSGKNPGSGSLNDGSGNNRIDMIVRGSDLLTFGEVNSGGAAQASMSVATASLNVAYKQAIAYAANDFAYTCNGGTVQTDTSGTVPTVDRLSLGVQFTSNNWLNGYLRKVAYYPTRLANTQLQALTAA